MTQELPEGRSREQILLRMKAFDPEGSYCVLTLGANRRGQPFWTSQSHWVG